MPLKANEKLQEYKIRVIDPISESYCSAKWLNATIWLGHGQTTSCHHPPAHKIDPIEVLSNPSAIHNTQHKKKMRKMMLEGIRPNECEYCWKVEQNLPNAISDRVYKTVIYDDEAIAATVQAPWDADPALKTLEISFERTCNFACSYCNPAFSTSWVRDIKRSGPYVNIISDGRGHFTDTAPWAESPKDEADNPYIQAFWKWWESDLADSLEEIRITGGEPLMAPSVWKLFQWFKDNPTRGRNIRFAINSNLCPKDEILDKLIELSHHVPHLEIYTSNESLGAHSEYIRDGMDYDKWRANMARLVTEGNIKSIHMMMTINSLCLSSITGFMTDMVKFKEQYGRQHAKMSLNILRFPSFQSCAILPVGIKDHYRKELEEWYANYSSKLNDWEAAQVVRLIEYLDVVKTPHQNTSDTPKLFNDFRTFYEQYDQRRGKNFRATFPELFVKFIDGIELVPGDPIPPTDPATMDGGYVSDEVQSHGWDTVTDMLGKNE